MPTTFAAFIRGISPMNAKMAAIREALEAAGFTQVKTVVSSGNATFLSNSASEAAVRPVRWCGAPR